MLGRVLSFSDPVIIKLLQENFIPLVGDDWYQRRRKDDVGKVTQLAFKQREPMRPLQPGGVWWPFRAPPGVSELGLDR